MKPFTSNILDNSKKTQLVAIIIGDYHSHTTHSIPYKHQSNSMSDKKEIKTRMIHTGVICCWITMHRDL